MSAEPIVVWMPGTVRTEVHLRGEDTGDAFCMLRDEPPAGWELPPHRHLHAAETIHVLAGELAVALHGGDEELVGAGETVHIPQGVLHTSRNAGAGALRRLVIFSPAGMERFFLEAGSARPDEVDPRAALAAALRHGWAFPGAS
jgi:quercetin dioxygenase-like cupin family protein